MYKSSLISYCGCHAVDGKLCYNHKRMKAVDLQQLCNGGRHFMGQYLNPGNLAFQESLNSEIYVDKSGIIEYCNRRIQTRQKYICVSRPRRFGKSMTADMLAAYYDESCDSDPQFESLEISSRDDYKKYLNRYHVLHINMQTFLSEADSVKSLLDNLQADLTDELKNEFGSIKMPVRKSSANIMAAVQNQTKIPFIIIIDEWDCLFREYQSDLDAQKKYLDFLRIWLKDRTYVGLCYMTGILPIKKYGTHSALNMFSEFSMEDPGELARFTGFTEQEVLDLCDRYRIDADECSYWYNGYYFRQCGRIYNPKSIVSVMLSGIFDDYWNKTETYEALQAYIDMNYDGLRDAIIAMMGGGRVRINTGSFQNDMTTFHNADDVLTLLVHLGYLGYDFDTKEVFVPNKEIMSEFVTSTTVSGWDEIVRSVKTSDQTLRDLLAGNAEAVAKDIERAHLETSHLQYNDENALSYTVSLSFYAARQYYTIIREMPAGKGFADLAFIPRKKYADMPAVIIELKRDASPEEAILQIRTRGYTEGLSEYKDNLLLVGISYDSRTKKHRCIIEKAQEEKGTLH